MAMIWTWEKGFMHWADGDRRGGQTMVMFLLTIILLVGICVFTIDVGKIVMARAQLQNAVDAAALAGASQLSGYISDDERQDATVEATALAEANEVTGTPLHLGTDDIEFGHFDRDTGTFLTEDQVEQLDSIRIRGRRSTDSPDGPINLLFGPVFGWNVFNIRSVQAVGTKPRRYVMFVLDRSGSMCFDTQGVTEKYSPVWDSEQDTYRMEKSPSGWYALPQYMYYSGSWHTAYFYAVDDNTGEVRTDFLPDPIATTLINGKHWRFRTPEGNDRPAWFKAPSDVTIYSSYATSNWYTYDYYNTPEQCDYATSSQPVQPLQSTMDAACAFVDLLNAEDDRAGLATFGSGGSLDQTLTDDWTTLKQTLQAFYPCGSTAEPAAMQKANDEMIDSGRADGYGTRIMILLTDGNANVPSGGDDDFEFLGHQIWNSSIRENAAREMEEETIRARNNGVIIYTVTFGDDVDSKIHPLIATETGGAHYWAANHEDLTAIFIDIFRRLPPILTL